MSRFEGVLGALSKYLDYVSRIGFFVMMALVTIDVILRYAWQSIGGAYDYVKLICAVSIAAGMALTTYTGGHIEVELFMERLPKRVQAFVGSIVSLVGIAFFVIAACKVFELGYDMQKAHETTLTVYVPYAPFMYFIGVGLAVTIMALIARLVRQVAEVFSPKASGPHEEEDERSLPEEHRP